MDVDLKALTRLGAQVRLAELVAEMDALLRQFPGIATQSPTPTLADAERRARPKTRKRRPMSAAKRKAVSQRMKKMWAERRKAEK